MSALVRWGEVERRLREHLAAAGQPTTWVGQGSASRDYRAAYEHGLITLDELDAARAHFGRQWDYAGD